MKILLAAVNAKYIHSNLAVYSLKAYAKEYDRDTVIAEYTINHRAEFILQELYRQKPDVLLFSCYIWNVELICELALELKKVMQNLPIWAGGPEVSYESQAFLEAHPQVDGILAGEGEVTFRELCGYYVNGEKSLAKIKGLVYREKDGRIVETPKREPVSMDALPFCYGQLSQWENRVIYYESSRGCPFRCSYCLSSIEKGLRLKSLPLVYQELSCFLKAKVPQVKFVDRTFNCSHAHAMAIWRFLKEHDNGITNFHFEISADLLTEEEIALMKTMRPGLIQLEIGVQSTNVRTLEEIQRKMDLPRLEQAVRQVGEAGNIHQHLDLIAGLPFEDLGSFQKSFDWVYALRPQQLQLGFLKVLKGSRMYEKQREYGVACLGKPPYEVLFTSWLSYGDLIQLKKVEEMLEVYYNSGQFELTIQVLAMAFPSPFEMFRRLGAFYEERGLFFASHSRMRRCEILLDFTSKEDPLHQELYQETLTFDLYHREHMKSRPPWAGAFPDMRAMARKLCGKGKNVHLEPFSYDFTGLLGKKQKGFPRKLKKRRLYLFSYEERDCLTGQADVRPITWEGRTDDKTDKRDTGQAG